MKLRNNQFSRLAPLALTASVLAALAGCGGVEKSDRTSGATGGTVDPRKVHASDDDTAAGPVQAPANDPKKDDAPAADDKPKDADNTDPATPKTADVQTVFVKAGLRNFNQINATMSTLTGVPRTNATVRTEFVTNLATSLPTDNDVKAFLGSQQVAVFKLAVEYCDALVKDTTLRAQVFGTFNFAATPAVAFNAAGKQAVAEALVGKFWGKDLTSLPAHAESTDEVVALLDALLQGKTMTTVAVTPAVVTATCAATLASAPVTIF